MIIPEPKYLVLKKPKIKKETKSGIILTNTAVKEPEIYEVVAYGEEVNAELGEKVIFSNYYKARIVEINGEEFFIVHGSDIVARYEDEK